MAVLWVGNTVFTRLNLLLYYFILIVTFELAEGGGTYSRAAFIISGSFASSHGAGGGYCGRAGSVRKGIAAAAHDAKREVLHLLDETFIISVVSE